jgi:hypothetical protein
MKLHSGEVAPKTGTYNVIDNKGKVCGTVRVNKGDRIPPTRIEQASHFEID